MNTTCGICGIAAAIEDEKLCAPCKDAEKIRIATIFANQISGTSIADYLTIFVWQFENAPKGIRALSRNGGDEDWVVYIPKQCKPEHMPLWIERLDTCGEPDEFILPNGDVVYIGSH